MAIGDGRSKLYDRLPNRVQIIVRVGLVGGHLGGGLCIGSICEVSSAVVVNKVGVAMIRGGIRQRGRWCGIRVRRRCRHLHLVPALERIAITCRNLLASSQTVDINSCVDTQMIFSVSLFTAIILVPGDESRGFFLYRSVDGLQLDSIVIFGIFLCPIRSVCAPCIRQFNGEGHTRINSCTIFGHVTALTVVCVFIPSLQLPMRKHLVCRCGRR